MRANEENPSPSYSRSHWVGWTLSILAVPVLYLLSVPALFYFSATNRKTRELTPSPEWVKTYASPSRWAYEHCTVLRGPMDTYDRWWSRQYAGYWWVE
ncbi:MAG TPA: hypothetical protein VLE43_14125 [Candidatus Saccharimonadia bacterium]|nr:hypothetical protein [Candidatus Saccharimonadia bacterium]